MAYYDAFVAKWATLSPGTAAQKLAQINAATAAGSAAAAIVAPSRLINAIVPADLAALTTAQVSMLALLLSGSAVDASAGTTIRAALQTIFAGKTTTLQNLATLAASFDTPTVPWWQANGYARPFDTGDVTAAGVS